MWSHYTDSHKGFVLGFDRYHPYFANSMPIQYSRYRTCYSSRNLHLFTSDDVTKHLSVEKAVDWAYEEEERLFLTDTINDVISVGKDNFGEEITLNLFLMNRLRLSISDTVHQMS